MAMFTFPGNVPFNSSFFVRLQVLRGKDPAPSLENHADSWNSTGIPSRSRHSETTVANSGEARGHCKQPGQPPIAAAAAVSALLL